MSAVPILDYLIAKFYLRQMQVGWVKIGHFRRKTVQDRRIVSIKVGWEAQQK